MRFEDRVEEPGLIEVVDGLGFVDAGEFGDVDGGLGEPADGFAEVGLTVADVGAEREVDGGHVWLLYACATAEKAEHGMGFGDFESEGDREEDDAVEAEDEDGEGDVAERTKREEQAAGGRGGE